MSVDIRVENQLDALDCAHRLETVATYQIRLVINESQTQHEYFL